MSPQRVKEQARHDHVKTLHDDATPGSPFSCVIPPLRVRISDDRPSAMSISSLIEEDRPKHDAMW